MSKKRRLSRVAVLVAAAVPAAQGLAAEGAASDAALEEVIVTGTRRAERTVSESSVPVDIVSAADLRATPAADLNNKLQATVPSYNVKRLPLSDGAIFVRPAALRGLSPDQTLVLVNGKRRHRSAFVDVTAQGAQAVDLSQIPQIALQRVEVLRDGASAQYGSDAIAGVINLILASSSNRRVICSGASMRMATATASRARSAADCGLGAPAR